LAKRGCHKPIRNWHLDIYFWLKKTIKRETPKTISQFLVKGASQKLDGLWRMATGLWLKQKTKKKKAKTINKYLGWG
jgi:hypothetical protein